VAGGIILSRQQGQGKMEELIPATQYLAAQIAAVLDKAAGYAQMIDHQKTVQELEIAGQIQESFLSVVQDVPRVEGWQVGIFFNPARETSGDFFDVVPLGKGKWAFVVAHVADKGMGAALYMALSRTLIRTYAIEYAERFKNGAEQPADVLRQANQRILSDTRSDLFVTVFFGLLDEHNGQFLYANAGHNPAFLIKEGAEVERMTRTGIPLGLFPDLEIHCAETHIKPGDTLILYTDGMTEAENDNGDFFGEQRFLQSIQRAVHLPVSDMMSAVLDEITTFVGEASQSDDLTMMVIRREK
jgi:serine phosphatase RsbU (regulator of sigma subunit)